MAVLNEAGCLSWLGGFNYASRGNDVGVYMVLANTTHHGSNFNEFLSRASWTSVDLGAYSAT